MFKTKKAKAKSQTKWLGHAEEMDVSFSISDMAIVNQCRAIGLTENDLKIAKVIQPIITNHLQTITAEFYQSMAKYP